MGFQIYTHHTLFYEKHCTLMVARLANNFSPFVPQGGGPCSLYYLYIGDESVIAQGNPLLPSLMIKIIIINNNIIIGNCYLNFIVIFFKIVKHMH